MQSSRERGLIALVLLNVALQVFDGVATYVGLHVGLGEGNPVVAGAVARLGTGPALVLIKLEACACLLALWSLRRSWLAGPALAASAALYAACSLGPWTLALARLI
ncbi:MAG TPA: DUF5658 family protein [Candidatus Binatia bacterium]|nr:DUF5658 family protein [Candidatus Binatia bacterium]